MWRNTMYDIFFFFPIFVTMSISSSLKRRTGSVESGLSQTASVV